MTENELKKLVERAKEKDNSAMEALYMEYYRELMYVCKHYNMKIYDAEDIIQDTFITAFNKLSGLNDTAKFGSWISRIAANKCLDLLRKNNLLTIESMHDSKDVFEIPNNNKNTEDVVIDKEIHTIITNMIQELPLEQRLTIFMYYYQDMSIKEIAASLNCSENTVKSRLNYARKHMRAEAEKLEKQGIRLRVVAVLPFLYAFFRWEEQAFACDIPNAAATVSMALSEMPKPAGETAGITDASVGATAKSMSVGKIVAITGGVLGAMVAVAGIIMAIVFGSHTEDKTENPETASTSANLETYSETIKDTDDIELSYDEDYNITVKLTKVKQFSQADFPEVEDFKDIFISSFTENTFSVHVSGYYGSKSYLYNQNGERINIEENAEFFKCEDADDYDEKPFDNLCQKYDYIIVDENVGTINTCKLIDMNGNTLIPAKYENYYLISDNFVIAKRGEPGDGTLSSDREYSERYHDVMDVYSLKTGNVIDGLSNIDSNDSEAMTKLKNISAYNGYMVNHDMKTAYDMNGNKADYNEIVHNDDYIIVEDILSSHLENAKGDVVSEYYAEIKQFGDYFIIKDQLAEQGYGAKEKSGYGILDKKGNIIVDCVLDTIWQEETISGNSSYYSIEVTKELFNHELWPVIYKGNVQFINKNGKLVGKPTKLEGYSIITDLAGNMVNLRRDGNNSDYQLVTPGGNAGNANMLNPYLYVKTTAKEDGSTSYTLYDLMGKELITSDMPWFSSRYNDLYIFAGALFYEKNPAIYRLEIQN